MAFPFAWYCAAGGVAISDALGQDHLARPLPVWQGCRLITAGEVFLMNRQSLDSLDGRYFGPLSTTTIEGPRQPALDSREGLTMPNLRIPDVIARPSSRLPPFSFPALAPLTAPSPAAHARNQDVEDREFPGLD
jgi:hypothetical protein